MDGVYNVFQTMLYVGIYGSNNVSQPKWFAGVDCANYVSQTIASHPEFDHTRFSTIIAVARFARD